METKANYTLIGVFTLAVIVGAFGFVWWFQSVGISGARAYYRVVFDGSVSGLSAGGPVLFNGIRVGEVTGLDLDPQHPERVVANIAIRQSVPVHKDTQVGMQFQGLTGIASLSLKGGTAGSPVLSGTKDNPAELVAPTTAAAGRDADRARRAGQARQAADRQPEGAAHRARQHQHLHRRAGEEFQAHRQHAQPTSTSSAACWRAIPTASTRSWQGMQDLTGGEDGKSGQINEAARSIRGLAESSTSAPRR